jgi:hypothetical protein
MIKITHLLLAGAVIFALCDVGLAQEPPAQPAALPAADVKAITDAAAARESLPPPLPGSTDYGVGGGVLEALPRPRDTPRSLFGPEMAPSTGGIRIDAPYFTPDPLLDPPFFPSPGWFAGAEVQIVKPHLIPNLSNSVLPGHFINNIPNSNSIGGKSTIVDLPSAPLDWTASPRIFAGYRFPAGFGEFMVAYRHLGTDGSGVTPGASGPVNLSSRFAFDMLDLDYNSRELSLWPKYDMKWTFGLRNLFLFFDSQGTQPFSQGPAGSVFQARGLNNLYGLGPHYALELNHRLGESGWSLYSRIDSAAIFTWGTNEWSAASSTLGPNGRPLVGQTNVFGHQMVPTINGRAGVSWQPSPTSGTRVFIGYQYEVFWALNRVPQSNGTPFIPPSLGQYWSQGIVLQATFKW